MRGPFGEGFTRSRPGRDWDWRPLGQPTRRAFEEVAAETFGMFDAHSRPDEAAVAGIAARLGEDVAGYLAANSRPRSDRRDEQQPYGRNPGDALRVAAATSTTGSGGNPGRPEHLQDGMDPGNDTANYFSLMYVGSPTAHVLTAAYVPGARYALIFAKPDPEVAVDAGRLRLKGFEQFAADQGALQNPHGWTPPPACGELAYSAAGMLIVRCGDEWARTRLSPNPGRWDHTPPERADRPFDEIVPELFRRYDVDGRRGFNGIAGWLGAEVFEYVKANTDPRLTRRDEQVPHGSRRGAPDRSGQVRRR